MFPYLKIFQVYIPTYGFFLATSIFLAGVLAYYRCRKAGLNGDDFIIIAVSAVGMGLVSAWCLYLAVTFSIREIIAIIQSGHGAELFQGGMVFYGGVIGGSVGALFGLKITKSNLLDYINPVIPSLPLAHAIGRIGCFGAGCCYGMPTKSRLGIAFLHPIGGAPADIALFPVQLFEAALNITIFLFLMNLTKRTKMKAIALPVYLICYGAVRFITEYFRADAVRGFLFGLSTSQWISLVLLIGNSIYLILISGLRKGKPV